MAASGQILGSANLITGSLRRPGEAALKHTKSKYSPLHNKVRYSILAVSQDPIGWLNLTAKLKVKRMLVTCEWMACTNEGGLLPCAMRPPATHSDVLSANQANHQGCA